MVQEEQIVKQLQDVSLPDGLKDQKDDGPLIEVVHEEPEQQSVSESGVERKPRTKKAPEESIKTRLNQVQREKYQALDALQQERAEKEELKRQMEFSTKSAMFHYDDSVHIRHDKARENLVRAKESGDVNAEVEATRELALTTSEMKDLNSWKAQNPTHNYAEPAQQNYNPQSQNYSQDINHYQTQNTYNWAQRNPWAIPNSQDYDADAATHADSLSAYLDLQCYRANNAHLIKSPEYFNTLDQWMDQYHQERQSAPQAPRKELNMRPTQQNYIAPTNRTSMSAQTANSPTRVSLSATEREHCRAWGIKEADYAKQKLMTSQKGPIRGRFER